MSAQKVIPFGVPKLTQHRRPDSDRCPLTEAGVYTNEDRCSKCPETHRCALNNHAGHNGRHPRKSETDQKRHGNCRRCAEASGAFDKRTEEPGDNNDLDATIRRDVGKSLAYRPDGAAFLQRIE